MKTPIAPYYHRVNQIALVVSYLAPLALLIWFVSTFGVNVPFGDQWMIPGFFAKIQTGQVAFQDFFAQHNEHRIFFPRIIIAILAFASSWNNKLEMYFSVGLAVAIFGVLFAIARRTRSDSTSFHLSIILCGAFLFSLDQQENWLWGFQLAWFLINFFVVVAIGCIVLPQRYSPTVRLGLAGLFCFAASFSSAHGLVAWLALVPLVMTLPGTLRQRALRVGLWLAAFVVVVAIYQIGYAKPGHHTDVFFPFKQPLAAINYLLTLLGFPIREVSITRSGVGAFFLLNFLLFNVYFLKKFHLPIANAMAAWLALGWFPLLFALITTSGRARFGAAQATSSRYISVIVLLLVALIQLWRIVIQEKARSRYQRTGVFFATILVVLLLTNSKHTIDTASSAPRAAAKTCLELIHFLDYSKVPPTASCLSLLFPDPNVLTENVSFLERLNFRQFPKPGEVPFVAQPTMAYGYIDAPAPKTPILLPPSQTILTTAGWATSLNQDRMPELVLFSYDRRPSFFGYGLTSIERPDVAKALKSERFLRSGWRTELHLEGLPQGKHTIQAWIYDQSKSKFYQLNSELVVDRQS